jgi:hypothetical protein
MATVLIALPVLVLIAIWPLLTDASNDDPATLPHGPALREE